MCTYLDDRDETLIAYLYDDIDAATRATFEAHVSSCAACRAELDGLRGVRQHLAAWAPPERQGAVDSRQLTVDSAGPRLLTVNSRPPAKASWLPDVPAWAQAAAAILIVGVAAGIANLDIRYDANGLSIRTGWSTPSASPTRTDNVANTVTNTVTRAELVALEQRLRDEVRTLQAGAHAVAASDAHPARAAAEGDLMRRVRVMLDEGEKRQQRELALRVGEVLRDVNAQRQADLVRIDRSLGLVENNLGVEVLKQRERVNYLLRVNQRQ
jgi:anti-sigma factor RsiW